MTEDLLRRWVRKELAPHERRDVSQWIVRCTSPDLGALLSAMIVEHADERANELLAARGSVWTRLVERWNQLLDLGAAHVSTGDASGLVLASARDPGRVEPLVLEADAAGARAVFVPPNGEGEVAVYLTDDQGRSERLLPPVPNAGAVRVELPSHLGTRPVVWAVQAASLPREPDVATELERAVNLADAAVWAARLSPDA